LEVSLNEEIVFLLNEETVHEKTEIAVLEIMAKCVMSLLDSKTEISAREERALAHLRNVTKGYKHNAEKMNGKKKKL
jgi:hypothetical protein